MAEIDIWNRITGTAALEAADMGRMALRMGLEHLVLEDQTIFPSPVKWNPGQPLLSKYASSRQLVFQEIKILTLMYSTIAHSICGIGLWWICPDA